MHGHSNVFIYLYQVNMTSCRVMEVRIKTVTALMLDSISCWSYTGGALKLRTHLADYTVSQTSWTQFEK